MRVTVIGRARPQDAASPHRTNAHLVSLLGSDLKATGFRIPVTTDGRAWEAAGLLRERSG